MFQIFHNYYYTQILLLISIATAIIIGFRRFRNLEKSKFLVFYAIASGLQCIISLYIQSFEIITPILDSTINISVNLFTLIELFTFSYLFYQILLLNISKRLIILLNIIYLVYILHQWIFQNQIVQITDYSTVISLFILFSFPFMYFMEILKDPPLKKLTHEPMFWVSTGLFILTGLLIPQFLIRLKMVVLFPSIYPAIFSITFIAYSILFFCISNAFIWKGKIPKY